MIRLTMCVHAMVLFYSFSECQASENPVFDNGLLTIPAIDTLAGIGRFQDVVIELKDQGAIELVDFIEAVPMRFLNGVEPIIIDSFPMQVVLKITGTLNSGCLEVGQVNQRLIEDRFTVDMYYLNNIAITNPGEIACTADVRPFTKYVPLDVYDLGAGTYEYSVNGLFSGEFSIPDFNGFLDP